MERESKKTKEFNLLDPLPILEKGQYSADEKPRILFKKYEKQMDIDITSSSSKNDYNSTYQDFSNHETRQTQENNYPLQDVQDQLQKDGQLQLIRDHQCQRVNELARCSICNRINEKNYWLDNRIIPPLQIYFHEFNHKFDFPSANSQLQSIFKLRNMTLVRSWLEYAIQRQVGHGLSELFYEDRMAVPNELAFLNQTEPFTKSYQQYEIYADFQGGNLGEVLRVQDDKLNILLRSDSNSRGNIQWFYFSILVMVPGKVQFSILNNRRNGKLFKNGMKLAVLDSNYADYGWMRAGENYTYEKNDVEVYRRAYYQGEGEDESSVQKNIPVYQTLTWSYDFKVAGQRVIFSYCFPYSFSQLCGLLNQLETDLQNLSVEEQHTEPCGTDTSQQIQKDYFKKINGQYSSPKQESRSLRKQDAQPSISFSTQACEKEDSRVRLDDGLFTAAATGFGSPGDHDESHSATTGDQYLKIISQNIMYVQRNIGFTRLGLPLFELTITSASQQISQKQKKKIILVISRQHPGETPGSFVCQGLIKFLLDPNLQQAAYLREIYIFQIIPMMNPDGVVMGNSRCSLSGCDLNRNWIEPDQFEHPQVFHTKRAMREYQQTHEIQIFCDLHGHSQKANSFIYGCNRAKQGEASSWTLVRLIPRILAQQTQFFSLSDCRFKVTEDKASTARVVVWNEFHIGNSFTLETSVGGYNDTLDGNKYKEFTIEDFQSLGRDLGLTFLEYSVISEKLQMELVQTKGWLKPYRLIEITGKTAKEQILIDFRQQRKYDRELKLRQQNFKIQFSKEKQTQPLDSQEPSPLKKRIKKQEYSQLNLEKKQLKTKLDQNANNSSLIEDIGDINKQLINLICPGIKSDWRDYFSSDELVKNFEEIDQGNDPNDGEVLSGSDSEAEAEIQWAQQQNMYNKKNQYQNRDVKYVNQSLLIKENLNENCIVIDGDTVFPRISRDKVTAQPKDDMIANRQISAYLSFINNQKLKVNKQSFPISKVGQKYVDQSPEKAVTNLSNSTTVPNTSGQTSQNHVLGGYNQAQQFSNMSTHLTSGTGDRDNVPFSHGGYSNIGGTQIVNGNDLSDDLFQTQIFKEDGDKNKIIKNKKNALFHYFNQDSLSPTLRQKSPLNNLLQHNPEVGVNKTNLDNINNSQDIGHLRNSQEQIFMEHHLNLANQNIQMEFQQKAVGGVNGNNSSNQNIGLNSNFSEKGNIQLELGVITTTNEENQKEETSEKNYNFSRFYAQIPEQFNQDQQKYNNPQRQAQKSESSDFKEVQNESLGKNPKINKQFYQIGISNHDQTDDLTITNNQQRLSPNNRNDNEEIEAKQKNYSLSFQKFSKSSSKQNDNNLKQQKKMKQKLSDADISTNTKSTLEIQKKEVCDSNRANSQIYGGKALPMISYTQQIKIAENKTCRNNRDRKFNLSFEQSYDYSSSSNYQSNQKNNKSHVIYLNQADNANDQFQLSEDSNQYYSHLFNQLKQENPDLQQFEDLQLKLLINKAKNNSITKNQVKDKYPKITSSLYNQNTKDLK